jgi:hypothetical protein
MAKPSRACGPAHQISKSVNVTTASVDQASNRHSGFAISKSRTGNKAAQQLTLQAPLNL